MGDFFKPWRRKFGVVTLGLSCMFAGVWVRSLNRSDAINAPLDDHNFYVFSFDGVICWGAWPIEATSTWSLPSFGTLFISNPDKARVSATLAEARDSTEGLVEWTAPYWSIVLPLTLISAYLLLGKPRPAKPIAAKPPESV